MDRPDSSQKGNINHNEVSYPTKSGEDRGKQVWAMSSRLIFVIGAGLALSGCCLGSGRYIQPPTNALASWDGRRPLPKRDHIKGARVKVGRTEAATSKQSSPSEVELSKLTPYSKEWAAVLNAINRAADDELKRRLVICRGCFPPEPDDQTGSIPLGGYLSARQQ
jgi:hypothetical protein